MREWFPFTNYDFYGYLASGLVVIFAGDYWLYDGIHMQRESWNFIDSVFAVSLAYVVGQLVAIPSSILIEHCFVGKAVKPPIKIFLSDRLTWCDRLVGCFVGRYYRPFPPSIRAKLLEKARVDMALDEQQAKAHPDALFSPAYRVARQDEDTRGRIDDFRNQYGFSRNMALTGLIVAGLMFDTALRGGREEAITWMVLSLLLSFGMLIRYLKFYSCFTNEVLMGYVYAKHN